MTTPPLAPPVAVPLLPPDATEGGLAFHRLVFARRRSGWWTPLVVGLLGAALYLAMLVVVTLGMFLLMLWNSGVADSFLRMTSGAAVIFDLTDPLMLAFMLVTIVLMLPAYVLASLIVNGRRLGLISSAAGRLRWGWLLLCTGIAVVVMLVVSGLSLLLPADASGDPGSVVAPSDNPQLWVSLAVILLLIPLQSAAEEYVFRGYLQQAIGRWLRHPLFAILLPVPLFVLGHLYDPLGQAGVAVFAVVAGWLTWRTGGLEAGIGLHIVNNLLAFLLALAGLGDVNSSSPGVAGLLVSTVTVVGYAVVVELVFRRSHIHRTLLLQVPAPQPVPAPVSEVLTPAVAEGDGIDATTPR
ncbi:CPBP family intramembrane glutamic endopeptidase [Microbacterium terricola]|uniref:CAAX amino protease n=1 Tax=Microbacterium terricola TaxID=344163 RepID=A0ABM8E0I4_9MICO|nr:type II CAAX endopeptidase family protein [Microbacterium terricola]UYK40950.1 CPBP family intramembrane metalloprotease [Microbacterium terricola]BDV31296.1 CAAX amino protease [Microbacterium terricola]